MCPAPSSPAPRPSYLPAADAGADEWEDRSDVFEVGALGSMPPPRRVVSPESEGPPPFDADVGELFNAYRAYVAKIGRRILGPSNEVEDLIQDVFLATVRDIHKLKDPARLGAWLGTITTRMARRRRYKNSVRPAPGPDDPEQLFERTSLDAPSPESRAELAGNVERVLSLPDELRTPWVLKHVEGRTLEDVAEQCECSLSTAQRRIQTASGRIHKRLR